ncbi:hypothetical protein [Microlunatus soli]|uniref:Uncharacterized protein n=1 Tax=Microlunatus soli TaxID=630515 RepID=A0A1H1Z834_9ACTN|nr:hypothetical protein [Microlunatus soli]SDT29682.1 hypothetical protein SAMN04489812_5038 [Microlunatus soli]
MTILAGEVKGRVEERPAPSVTYWLTASPWHGQAPVDDLYREYLDWSAGAAVPFDRFLHDVGVCGPELILADGMFLFSRP